MESEKIKLRQYLLGNLTGKETEEIDLQIISGTIPDEDLSLAEEDLMEAYLEASLSAREIELFKRNFLVSDERKSELAQVSLLKKHAQTQATRDESPVVTERDLSFFQRLNKYILTNLRPVTALLALIVLGLLAGITWRLFFYEAGAGDLALRERELTELNRQDLSNLARFENLSKIHLAPGAFRESDATRISAAQLSDPLLFRLALPPEIASADFFAAKLVTDQKTVFSIGRLPAFGNQVKTELRLLLPAALLKKGAYRIEIAPENDNDAPVIYRFSVQ